MESRVVVTRDQGQWQRDRRLVVNGFRVSVWEDETFWRGMVVMIANNVNPFNATELHTKKLSKWKLIVARGEGYLGILGWSCIHCYI